MIEISQIKLLAGHSEKELECRIKKILRLNEKQKFTYRILKKSIDARRDDVYIIYNIGVELAEGVRLSNKLFKSNPNVVQKEEMCYRYIPQGKKILKKQPIVVGSGPAGLFCAYMLADYGYSPLIIERGSRVEERQVKVECFWRTGKLDTQCNVQFGEGGAGTFSDGKLNTVVKDKKLRGKKVLETFVNFGARENILYDAKPHIGTDDLAVILINMRKRIEELGGRFLFDTLVTDIVYEDGCVRGVKINGQKFIESEVVVLAPGHSSRDTFGMLSDRNIHMIPKAFAVGVRAEHRQDFIQKVQYKQYAGKLPAASYKVAYQSGKLLRGVYSFCMCPGGYVVNASSEEGEIAVNGMSYNARDGVNANSAIIVTVTPHDFDGTDVLAGVRFQRNLERAAYNEGNGSVPVQLFADFKANRKSSSYGNITPQIKGKFSFANLNNCLPKYVRDTIVEGMADFDKRMPGFAAEDVVFSGVESRTSSPVRIVRDDLTLESVSCRGLYPCGEGAGYAGGIMSAAMDGIKVFEAIAEIYKAN